MEQGSTRSGADDPSANAPPEHSPSSLDSVVTRRGNMPVSVMVSRSQILAGHEENRLQ
jgi:hypothetical protein